MSVTLHVCITCKAGETVPEGAACPGTKLHAALVAAGAPEAVQIVPVECLSACSQGLFGRAQRARAAGPMSTAA